MRQAVARARPDHRDGHPRPRGGVLRRPRPVPRRRPIVDEMSAPTPDRVLDRMKQLRGVIAMFRTTLKNLAARKLRLLTTSIAVLLGVAFMAGTLVLTDTIGQTFDDLFADANAGTDAYVRGEAAFEDDELGDQRARLDAVPRRHHRRRRRRGRRRARASRPTPSSSTRTASPSATRTWARPPSGPTGWPTTTSTRSTSPTGGRPEAADEVVIDQGSADDGRLPRSATTATVLTQAGRSRPSPSSASPPSAATDSPGGASFALFTLDAAADLPDRSRARSTPSRSSPPTA